MVFSNSALIPIFATVIYGVIFIFVIISKPRTRLKEIFSLYLLSMILWSISAFLILSGLGIVLPWFRLMSASQIVVMLFFFFFVQAFFGLRRKWRSLAIIYGFLAFPVTLLTNLVIQSASLDQTGTIQYELGTLFFLVATPGYALFIVCARDLIRGIKRTHDVNQKNMIRYLLIGFTISVLGTLTDLTPLGKYPIDITANCVTAGLIAYAILRHKLLDIQIIIRVGLVYSIVTAIYSGVYYLSISLLLTLFTLYTGKAVFYVSLLVGAVTAILLNPLRDLAQSWIDRLFYRDKYNAELMLQRLSRTTTSFVEIEKLAHLILSEIRDTLHIEHGAILIKHNDSGNFQVIPENGEKKYFPSGFRADHPIISWLKKNNQALTNRDLLFNPIFRSMWQEENEELQKFNAEILLPLSSNEELIGILALGKKLSTQPYTQNEELLFSTLANQTAVAVENARLYDELRASFIQSVTALANAIDIRDTYTITHSQQIANWAAKTAHQLGCTPDEVNEIFLGGMLHDIGKIGIPDSILQKPAQLTEEEWKIVRTHPALGAELISPIKKLAGVAPMVENSHERFDGLGYPQGKKGTEIPLGARIISVVDSYSAMHDTRPYKKPYNTARIINELKQNSGKMYDPMVVDAFLKVIQSDGIDINSAEGE